MSQRAKFMLCLLSSLRQDWDYPYFADVRKSSDMARVREDAAYLIGQDL